jgi:hypothetical protein
MQSGRSIVIMGTPCATALAWLCLLVASGVGCNGARTSGYVTAALAGPDGSGQAAGSSGVGGIGGGGAAGGTISMDAEGAGGAGAAPADSDAALGSPSLPPPGWLCGWTSYGSGDGCDCGCGIPDPDCGSLGCTDPGCYDEACQTCNGGNSSSYCPQQPADAADPASPLLGPGAQSCKDFDGGFNWTVGSKVEVHLGATCADPAPLVFPDACVDNAPSDVIEYVCSVGGVIVRDTDCHALPIPAGQNSGAVRRRRNCFDFRTMEGGRVVPWICENNADGFGRCVNPKQSADPATAACWDSVGAAACGTCCTGQGSTMQWYWENVCYCNGHLPRPR